MPERDQEAQQDQGDPDPRSTTVMAHELVDLAAAESEHGSADERPVPPPEPGPDEAGEDEAKRRHREASRRGGLKGGRARAAKLSAERRSEIARAAARARWAKRRRDSA